MAGVLLLLSCSSGDDAEPTPITDKRPISFAGSLTDEEAVTRATSLESVLTNKTFTVWSYKNDAYDSGTGSYTSSQVVMPAYTVNWIASTAHTTTTNTHDWEYVGQGTQQEIKYWDMDAKAYRFFGYANGNATADPATSPVAVSTASTTDAFTMTATVDAVSDATIAAAPYFTKLWFSDGNPTTYPDRQFGKPVVLQFLKPFARVRFTFTFAEGLTISSTDLVSHTFKPTDTSKKIANAGTVAVAYPLKGTEDTESWTVSCTTGIDQFNTIDQWYDVLPAENQGSYTVSVQISEEKTAEVPAEYMNWKPGYEYTYRFKITDGGGITLDDIQVAINDWVVVQNLNHSVYNW